MIQPCEQWLTGMEAGAHPAAASHTAAIGVVFPVSRRVWGCCPGYLCRRCRRVAIWG